MLRAAFCTQVVDASLDYAAVSPIAEQLALRPWLTSTVLSSLPSPGSAPAVLNHAQQDAARRLTMTDDLVRTAAILNAHAVPFVVIKGGALLAITVYTTPWRHTEDIDVVVAPGLVEHARRILVQHGWTDAAIGESVTVDGNDIRFSLPPDHHAVFPLAAPGGTMVDLHRSLPSSQHRLQAVFRRSRTAMVWGEPVSVPSPTDLLTILSEHVWIKHRASPESLARHLHDARVLLQHGAVPRDPWSNLTHTLLDAMRREPDGPAARLAIPEPAQLSTRRQLDAIAEQLVRLRRNARWSPGQLVRKVVPADAWMDEHFGPADSPTIRALQHFARWQVLLRRSLPGAR
jgi:hypothetical protein